MERFPNEREERCKDRFDAWLRANVGAVDPQWTYEPKGHSTPPDFWLDLDGERFAVEITSIESAEEVLGVRVTESGWYEAFLGLKNELEHEAAQISGHEGLYRLFVHAVVPKWSRRRSMIKTRIQQYIAATQGVDQSEGSNITVDGQDALRIEKAASTAPLFISLNDFSRSWPDDNFRPSLQEAVLRKIEILGSMALPCILILEDHYRLPDPVDWDAALRDIGAQNFFHSIFIVRGVGAGYLLATKDQKWPALDTAGSVYHAGRDIPGWRREGES